MAVYLGRTGDVPAIPVGEDRADQWIGSVASGPDDESVNRRVFVDRALLDAAVRKMEQYDDKALSLPDRASFALMDQLGLDTAFAFDADFRDCGYRILPPVGPERPGGHDVM